MPALLLFLRGDLVASCSVLSASRYFLLPFGIFALLSLSARAELIRHDRDENDYAERAKQPQFRCVAFLTVRLAPDFYRKRGTGVLIAPQWLLTNAHVAKLADKETLDDHEWDIAGRKYHPQRIVLHPSYRVDKDAEVMSNGWDLGLVKLDRPVEEVTPAVCYADSDEVGQTATLVGDGRVGDGINGPKLPYTKRLLAGENVIDSVGAKIGTLTLGEGTLLFDFDHPNDPCVNYFGDSTPLNLEAGMSHGDSGGGIFVRKDDQWYLAGLMTFSPPRSGNLDEPPSERQLYDTYGQIGAGIRISNKLQWINEVLGDRTD